MKDDGLTIAGGYAGIGQVRTRETKCEQCSPGLLGSGARRGGGECAECQSWIPLPWAASRDRRDARLEHDYLLNDGPIWVEDALDKMRNYDHPLNPPR